MRLVPVLRRARVDLQRHVQPERRLGRLHHHLRHHRSVASISSSGASNTSSSCTCSSMRALRPGARQRLVHADHRAADDVGGGALDRRVDRGALVEGALGGVRRR